MTLEGFSMRLKEFDSKVFFSPIKESEAREIERRLNRKLPQYYREFLMTIGLKQDVIFGLIDKVSDFDPLIDFLPKGQAKNHFRFGDNGGEDYWLLRSDDFSDHNIYEYEYYGDGKIKSIGKTFEDLLSESYSLLKMNKDRLVDNSKKVRSVQFSIDTDNFDQIIQSLRNEFRCSVSREIGNMQVSSAGVITSNGTITLEGIETLIKKQEYNDWKTASYYFNWNESVHEINTNSIIERVEATLRNDGLNVTVIDYGIRVLD